MTEPVKRYYITESAVVPMLDKQMTYTPLVNYKTDVHVVPLVMAADYAALEAENENLRLSWGLLRSENNALRQQRDKLAGLLREVKSAYTTAIHWEDMQKAMAQIDAALAEIKP